MAERERLNDSMGGLEVDHSRYGPRSPDPKGGLEYNSTQSPPYTFGNGEKQTHTTTPPHASKHNVPFGLSAVVFAIIVAAITALVVGGAVGGGVAGAMSGSDDTCSSSPGTTSPGAQISGPQTMTATVTATISAGEALPTTDLTDYSPARPQDVKSLSWNCPDQTSYSTSQFSSNQAFNVYCNTDFNNGRSAIGGGIVGDIGGLIAYSPETCMDACTNFNLFQVKYKNETRCAAITWGRSLSKGYKDLGGNCWLKNGSALNPLGDANSLSASVIFE